MDKIAQQLFTSVIVTSIDLRTYLVCAAAALVAGIFLALVLGMFNGGTKYSHSFLCTVVILPLVVGTVIMLVNGNVGTGIAVAGAFSLVRFRSAPGSARDIAVIFLAMAAGLACGTGYIGVCGILVLISAVMLVALSFVGKKTSTIERELRITIPEDIDYEGVFDDIFAEYTKKHTLFAVKTTNMGSLFKLKYRIIMKNGMSEKAFIDALRVRNGNLEITMSYIIEEEVL